MATGKRGLKLHSIIEKLSEQCERKSPLLDEEGEDSLTSEVLQVKRKQRKGNGVKRVCKEVSSRSSSEDGLSDEEVAAINVEVGSHHDESVLHHGAWKIDSNCVKKIIGVYDLISAKRNAQTAHTIKQRQCSETRTSYKKVRLPTFVKGTELREGNHLHAFEGSGSSGSDKDLNIDVEAFVNHVPVLEDVDQTVSSACPFCSVLYEDVTQHIKDCHSECAVVDDSVNDEDMSDSSYIPEDSADSDEDFTPYKKAKRKKPQGGKLQKLRDKKADDESYSKGELCIDVENVIKTDSGIKDIDGGGVQSTTPLKLSTSIRKDSANNVAKFCCGCQGCGKRFRHWDELRKHFDEKEVCRKLYQCDECDQICVTLSFLKKHKRLHSKEPKERSHKCDVCDADFTNKAHLKRHTVTHAVVKEFECEICHKMFAYQRTLKEHRRRHTGEKPYKCEYCDAAFTHSSGLKTHITKHTGIRQYKCHTCGKLFAKSYGLKMHAISHSKDKPFVCEVCGKGFKRPDHFKQHKIIHSDSKPFKCDTCQRTFNQKVCLRKHLPCREHEKQQKKLQKSLAKESKTRNKTRRYRKSSTGEQKSVASSHKANSQQCSDNRRKDDTTISSDCCDHPKDLSLDSAVDTCPSEASMLSSSYPPPSFVRQTSTLIDSEYYSDHSETSDPHDRDLNSLLSLPHTMFSCVEDTLSLDTLPPLSSHDTHALSGRPLSNDSSTDLGSVMLSSTMAPDNLSSMVGETNSLFGQE